METSETDTGTAASRRNKTGIDTVVLDLDGTLVDSVPVHVLAWQAAFRDVGLEVASHRIQRVIGMGGDKLVAELTSAAVERSLGAELRRLHPEHLDELFGRILPTDGAQEMLTAMRDRGLRLVLASSSDRDLTERLLDLVPGADTLLHATVSGSDADESKPSGQLIEAALREVDAGTALVVGDAVWDVRAAAEAGVRCLALLTGGISEAELREAGAADVLATPRAVAERLTATGTLLG